MFRANLKILHFRCEVTLYASASVWLHFYLRMILVPPYSIRMDAMQDFVEPGERHVEFRMRAMMLLTGGDLGELVFDNSVHIADCEENPPSQLVLIIQGQPL